MNHVSHAPQLVTYQGCADQTAVIIYTPPTNDSDHLLVADLTNCSKTEIKAIATAFDEYNQYVETHMKTMYSLEDWNYHVAGPAIQLKSVPTSTVTKVSQ